MSSNIQEGGESPYNDRSNDPYRRANEIRKLKKELSALKAKNEEYESAGTFNTYKMDKLQERISGMGGWANFHYWVTKTSLQETEELELLTEKLDIVERSIMTSDQSDNDYNRLKKINKRLEELI